MIQNIEVIDVALMLNNTLFAEKVSTLHDFEVFQNKMSMFYKKTRFHLTLHLIRFNISKCQI